jgi:hypothetical protein
LPTPHPFIILCHSQHKAHSKLQAKCHTRHEEPVTPTEDLGKSTAGYGAPRRLATGTWCLFVIA